MNKKEQEIIKIICEHPDAYHDCILAFIEYINVHNFNRTYEITIQRLDENREAFINEIKNQLEFINLNFSFSNSYLNESTLINKGIILEKVTDQITQDAYNFYDFSDFSLKSFFAKYDLIQEYLSMESIISFKLPHDTTDLEKLIIKSFMQHNGAFEMIKQEFDTNRMIYHAYKQLMSNIKKLSDITGIAIDCSNYNNLDDFRNINQHELENNYSDSKNNVRIILNMLLDPEQSFNIIYNTTIYKLNAILKTLITELNLIIEQLSQEKTNSTTIQLNAAINLKNELSYTSMTKHAENFENVEHFIKTHNQIFKIPNLSTLETIMKENIIMYENYNNVKIAFLCSHLIKEYATKYNVKNIQPVFQSILVPAELRAKRNAYIEKKVSFDFKNDNDNNITTNKDSNKKPKKSLSNKNTL